MLPRSSSLSTARPVPVEPRRSRQHRLYLYRVCQVYFRAAIRIPVRAPATRFGGRSSFLLIRPQTGVPVRRTKTAYPALRGMPPYWTDPTLWFTTARHRVPDPSRHRIVAAVRGDLERASFSVIDTPEPATGDIHHVSIGVPDRGSSRQAMDSIGRAISRTERQSETGSRPLSVHRFGHDGIGS
jgi:hypothetical protein